MTQRILFLDFDGVLNSEDYVTHRAPKGEFLAGLDPLAITNLNTLVERCDCYVVLSTSWRIRPLGELGDLLQSKGFAYRERILGKTGVIRRGDFVDQRAAERGHECAMWLHTWLPEAAGVMLDDDGDCWEMPLVQTDWRYGLLPGDVGRVREAFEARRGVADPRRVLTEEALRFPRLRGVWSDSRLVEVSP